ncbi:BON domain-containing protein [Acanthopleuribacter pedis]|uniref:BON domain-containing protein n=1 Tax=Acanthopleuribacter pedis TaxID=442870 RepID=A0A8J7QN91_9BACT|nr:BON domain-containing protein [Acanthopleuribacter pedis]MBO1321130.1 BON domain-containing protein [Acanthopleuribacter pedis]
MKYHTLIALLFALTVAFPVNADSNENVLEDSIIASKLWASYALSESLNPLTIDIDVSDGVVALHGEVDNRSEKNLAGSMAEGTKGVRTVENYLKIAKDEKGNHAPKKKASLVHEVGSTLNDAAINVAVSSRLVANKHVSGFSIDVEVADGHVSLAGQVSDADSRKIAESIAKNTRGVKTVNSHLAVKESDKKEKDLRLQHLTEKIDDMWVATKVNSQYAYTRGVDATDIDVDVDEGVVTLKGHVAHKGEKELACKIAEDTLGVRRVNADALEIR